MIRSVAKRLISPFRAKEVNPFHDYPFGKQPLATKQKYMDIWEKAKRKSYSVIDEYEKNLGFNIDTEWVHNLAFHTQVVIKKSEICYQHGRLLYATLSDYVGRDFFHSINILETGTARGFSALCMAKALADQNKEGRIITIDQLPHNVKMYWNCIDDNDGAKSRAQLLFDYSDLIRYHIWFLEGKSEDILSRLELSRIHFAFLDGGHEYEDVKFEIDHVVPRQKKGDIIFFDDYQESYFPGIVKAVEELEKDGSYRMNTIAVSEQRGYAIAEKLE
jgi:predicted O-methyltransferase YrrM